MKNVNEQAIPHALTPKAEVTAVLRAIQEMLPSALVLGGMPRDLDILNRDGDDLDIFVSYDDYIANVEWFHENFMLTDKCKHFVTSMKEQDRDPDALKSGIHRVFEPMPHFIRGLNMRVDVVVLSEGEPCTVDTLIQRGDFGLCRIVYDGKQCYVTESYLADSYDLTLTLMCAYNRNSVLESLKRFDKWTSPYQNLIGETDFAKLHGFSLKIHPEIMDVLKAYPFVRAITANI